MGTITIGSKSGTNVSVSKIGPRGPQGDIGPQGEIGPQGVQGIQGVDTALVSANNAANSASNASTSASNALTYANIALTSKNAALLSEQSALASKNAADVSANNAQTSETNALEYKNAALLSANNAQTSETNALEYKNAAELSATNAATSETNALNYKNAANISAINAATSASNSAISATSSLNYSTDSLANKNATTISETNAALSEINALAYKNATQTIKDASIQSAINSASSATASALSETNALEYKNAALLSANNALTSETNALTSKNSAKTSKTNAKQSEDIALEYKNAAGSSALSAETSKDIVVSNTNVAITSASNALLSEQFALASKNSAKISETNAALSATNAENFVNSIGADVSESANNASLALSSKISAELSEANALEYKNAAELSATNAASSESLILSYTESASISATIATNSAATAVTSEANALTASISALASSNYKGLWASLTGALNVPSSVLHLGEFWLLSSNLANVTTAVPGTSTLWVSLSFASVIPTANKSPLAGLDGKISANWIRQFNNDIGVPGAQGFGVGICPTLPSGFSAMSGSNDIASDNYGNYQYTDGSVMCWIPAFYYRYGSGTNGASINNVEIKSYSAYSSVAVANLDGFALHRAFYDGGNVQLGVMVDKYQVSNNAGIASSIKNGKPLSTASAHNPYSGLNGTPPNNYFGSFAVAKTRGTNFFCNTRFIFSALALLSLAHAQYSKSVAQCAWYNVTNNFPKGNNNSALRDANDTTVLYTTDGYSNCGLTGSGLPFAKTTHNGQNSGVADLNGNVWEVSPGMTCVATSKNITAITQSDPCAITIAAHGLSNGTNVMVRSVGGMTQLNDRFFTVTVIDVNTFSLDLVNSSAFSAYTSGGNITFGTFYTLKTSVAMKSVTGGNSLATDHWGAAGLAALFETFAPSFNTSYPNNSLGQRYGNGTFQVLADSVSGAEWTKTGLGLPRISGFNLSGSNAFGVDQFYQYIVNELCPRSGGGWYGGALAGVWNLALYGVRGGSNDDVGCRAALYL